MEADTRSSVTRPCLPLQSMRTVRRRLAKCVCGGLSVVISRPPFTDFWREQPLPPPHHRGGLERCSGKLGGLGNRRSLHERESVPVPCEFGWALRGNSFCNNVERCCRFSI